MKRRGKSNRIVKSCMYKRKSRGPRTDPCGTPKLTLSKSDEIPLIEMYILHSVCKIGFKPVISYYAYSIIPQLF